MTARSTLRGLVAVLLLACAARAQGPYGLSWSTVDSGGKTFSTGGGYTLGGTAGQPDAGVLSGGAVQVAGGFWSATTRLILPTATPTATPGGPTPTPTSPGVPVPTGGEGGGAPALGLLAAILGALCLGARRRPARRPGHTSRSRRS
jgi:hypothetical protein